MTPRGRFSGDGSQFPDMWFPVPSRPPNFHWVELHTSRKRFTSLYRVMFSPRPVLSTLLGSFIRSRSALRVLDEMFTTRTLLSTFLGGFYEILKFTWPQRETTDLCLLILSFSRGFHVFRCPSCLLHFLEGSRGLWWSTWCISSL